MQAANLQFYYDNEAQLAKTYGDCVLVIVDQQVVETYETYARAYHEAEVRYPQ